MALACSFGCFGELSITKSKCNKFTIFMCSHLYSVYITVTAARTHRTKPSISYQISIYQNVYNILYYYVDLLPPSRSVALVRYSRSHSAYCSSIGFPAISHIRNYRMDTLVFRSVFSVTYDPAPATFKQMNRKFTHRP